ncbi:hypothetical protein HIR70_00015, partial [Pasteurella multocida]|nr:hypothetical protein [Pasteurella multocida]NMR61167.1 hypothetical protein [Pasteurella multocida]
MKTREEGGGWEGKDVQRWGCVGQNGRRDRVCGEREGRRKKKARTLRGKKDRTSFRGDVVRQSNVPRGKKEKGRGEGGGGGGGKGRRGKGGGERGKGREKKRKGEERKKRRKGGRGKKEERGRERKEKREKGGREGKKRRGRGRRRV